jgi:hypothetical protein
LLLIVLILTAIVGGGISKAATVLSVLIKVCTIPYNDRGHINVMLVLQSCTDCLQVMAGSSAGTFPTPSDGTYGVGNMEVEEDIEIKEESIIAITKEEDTGIKQEEIPLSCIKSEPDEVSYGCVCVCY